MGERGSSPYTAALLENTTRDAPAARAVSAGYGHTHLDELVELFRELPEALASPHIVVKHFSMKYDEPEIRAAWKSLPNGLRERVTMLV